MRHCKTNRLFGHWGCERLFGKLEGHDSFWRNGSFERFQTVSYVCKSNLFSYENLKLHNNAIGAVLRFVSVFL